MQTRGHTKHTCHLSNISIMDNNIQISNPTLELSSEEDMPIYPLMYNIYYDTSVCYQYGELIIHNHNRCTGKLMCMNFQLHPHTNLIYIYIYIKYT